MNGLDPKGDTPLSSSATASDSTRSPAERPDAKSRILRLAALRSAERALMSCCLELQNESSIERAKDLRLQLESLADLSKQITENTDSKWIAALESVDTALDTRADQLLTYVDATPMSQLRSTLPDVVSSYPRDVIYLVDLLVEDSSTTDARLLCVEYLVTLLCSERRGGVTCISRDPAQLSPAIAAFCARAESSFPGDVRAAELEFHQAASLLGEAPDPAIVREEARDLKTRLGIYRFAPNIVRAIVSYNIQLRNLIQIRVQTIRQSDESLLGHIPAETVSPDMSNIPPDTGGIFDSPGLRQIVDALRRRLSGAIAGSCASESIALRLEISDLEPFESEALCQASPNAQHQLIANTVVVGLMLRILPVIDEPLLELGLTPERLEEHWIDELDEFFKQATRSKLGVGEYEAACALSETRTKYLYASLAERTRKAARTRKIQPDSSLAATAGQDLLDAVQDAGRASVADEHPHAEMASNTGSSWEWLRERAAKSAGVAALLLVGFVALNVIGFSENEIRDLERPQLVEFSKYLSSAYRDGAGRGPLMVGRMRIDWYRLDPADKRQAASDMIRRVGERGVSRLMVYDDNYRLLLQSSEGQIRTIR